MPVKVLTSEEEARALVVQALEKAFASGRWMVVAWCVRDGKIGIVDPTTWDFPSGDFEAAQRQLKAYCDEELKRLASPAPREPLPMADWVKKLGSPPEDGNTEGRETFREKLNLPPIGEIVEGKPEPPPNRETREGDVPPPFDKPDDLQVKRDWGDDKGE